MEALRRFNDFWFAIIDILKAGHFVYCSGRSTILFNLGCGKYKDFPSPSSVDYLLFGTLKPHNIKSILNQSPQFIAIKEQIRNQLADFIYDKTSGVPRFVTYALEYIYEETTKNNSAFDKLNQTDMYQFFGAPFRNFIKQPGRAGSELNPLTILQGTPEEKIYLDLIEISCLNLPIDLSG